MVLSESKRKAGRYCCAYACKEKPVLKKGGLCHKHYRRKRREEDPVGVRYNGFKNKAKARGKEFTITLKEFRDFCQRTGYIITKGRRGQNATVDRRCNAHGYHIWNIHLMSNAENARKGNRFNGNKFSDPNQPDPDLPF